MQELKKTELLKKGIWLYFFLLIFEGAIRKWVLPSLATPLLIIRDPIAVWLLISGLKKGLLRHDLYLTGIVFIGIISIFTAIFLGHGNFFVALFGARIYIIHFPLIFLIGNVFEEEDVLKMGKAFIWLSIPMAILIGAQFYSPQSSWVNAGIGTDSQGGGFDGAMGFFRPPATFSFITGTASFFSIVACFIFYFGFKSDRINKLLLLGSAVALIASIPLSISRTLFFNVAVTFLFAIIAALRKPKYLGSLCFVFFIMLIASLFLNKNGGVQTALEAFTSRFETASEIEGGLNGVIGGRFFGGLFEAIAGSGSSKQPFWGYGIGMGTNVGAMLLTGTKTFLLSEGEWGRIIGEQGPLLGIFLIILRLGLCIKLAVISYKKLLVGNLLPWMLLNFCLINLAQGQWSQPTSLGFSVLLPGLLIASLRENPEAINEELNESENPNVEKPVTV